MGTMFVTLKSQGVSRKSYINFECAINASHCAVIIDIAEIYLCLWVGYVKNLYL